MNPLLTVQEAADILKCKRTTIFRLLSEGQLQRGLKLGKQTVVTAESVYALIAVAEAPKVKVAKKATPKPKLANPPLASDWASQIKAIPI